MEISSQILISLGQIIALGSWLTWLSRRNADKIDALALDVAVIKSITIGVKDDHDTIIILNEKVNKLSRDVNNLGNKFKTNVSHETSNQERV